MKDLFNFKKSKNYLICVDSDGCVMNTMDIKHINCFGPCLIEEWALQPWQKAIIDRWNKINLYNITRGINRFKGLSLILSEINERYKPIEGVKVFAEWVNESPTLSEEGIIKAIEDGKDEDIFKKALSWSKQVNRKVAKLREEDKLPFPLAKEALQLSSSFADIAMVSSANRQSVIDEWASNGLIDYVDVILTQNDGSKADCIGKLINKGYEKERVIMCGDAVNDLNAAKANLIFFYPIIAGEESKSWQEFIDNGLARLIDGSYKKYEEQMIIKFYNNLNK
jgi:phosphoglycolate phosphatase-like HAD superfamily hydrolase